MAGFIQWIWGRLATEKPIKEAPIHVKILTEQQNGKLEPQNKIKIKFVEIHT